MTATTPQIGLDELRTLFLFESLPDADLQWIADRAELRVYEADSVVWYSCGWPVAYARVAPE